MIAWLFPGQGALRPGAATWLADAPAVALASEACGTDLSRVLRRGGPELGSTAVLQPLLVALAVAVGEHLEGAPDVVAGHSVGEIGAWWAAGGIDATEAVALATTRGRAMEQCARARPGGMVSVAEAPAQLAEGVVIASTAPGEVVLSGDRAAIEAIPGVRVPVAGAWHSPLMEDAVPDVARALDAIPRRPLRSRFVSPHRGREADDVPACLLGQITAPMRWSDVLVRLGELGVTDVVAIAPGRLIRRDVAMALPGVRVHDTDDAASLHRTIEALR